MEEIKGYVDHIIFQNDNKGFKIIDFSTEEEDIVCVGIFPSVSQGENLSLCGEFIEHPTYGREFKVEKYEVIEPETKDAIERYLASGVIKGIGKGLSKRIVAKFKEDTIRIIEEEPERLAEIKGISINKAIDISNQIIEKKELRDAMIFLEKFGIGNQLALKIYGMYGEEVYDVIKNNPYQIADEVKGVGFRIADEIAMKQGIAVDDDYRIKSCTLYLLSYAAGEGNTYVKKDKLLDNVEFFLKIKVEDFDIILMNLQMDRKIVIKEEMIYLSMYYYMENKSARMLLDLKNNFSYNEKDLDIVFGIVEKKEEIELDDLQKEAVKCAISSGVCVITGGPGTGKTTTLTTLIEYFEMEGLDIFLSAPTGRAAKRMSEATNRPARTIHRMLEVSGVGENEKEINFDRNEDNPLECDVIIVDEVSMVDIYLLYSLLLAIAQGTRLILVGDVNQLPSVGPGNVLRDIVDTGVFSTVTLDRIFRQANKSDIVKNAHQINKGIHPDIDVKSDDFFFLKRTNSDLVIESVLKLLKSDLYKYVESNVFDIQVLSPSKKGLCGVNNLNKVIQEDLNPQSKAKNECVSHGSVFREGDKVMQVTNDYKIKWKVFGKYGVEIENGTGVYNGDVGVVKIVSHFDKTVTVVFDEEKHVTYTFEQLDELELAYATTIHKSQGSEYPAVIIPLLDNPKPLMNRNLIYTAVTRAKSAVLIVGSKEDFYEMIDNESENKRNSSLGTRVLELC